MQKTDRKGLKGKFRCPESGQKCKKSIGKDFKIKMGFRGPNVYAKIWFSRKIYFYFTFFGVSSGLWSRLSSDSSNFFSHFYIFLIHFIWYFMTKNVMRFQKRYHSEIFWRFQEEFFLRSFEDLGKNSFWDLLEISERNLFEIFWRSQVEIFLRSFEDLRKIKLGIKRYWIDFKYKSWWDLTWKSSSKLLKIFNEDMKLIFNEDV